MQQTFNSGTLENKVELDLFSFMSGLDETNHTLAVTSKERRDEPR